MQKQLGLIKPDALDADTKLIKKVDHPTYQGTEVFFVRKNKHIIIYRQSWVIRKDTGERRFLANQLEIPAAGIQWFIDSLENKFLKHSSEGGLPPGILHYEDVIDGEELQIRRGVAIGGEGIGGYVLTNVDRKGYISQIAKQDFSMPDPFLFEHGLLDFLKELGGKITRGEV